MEAEDDSVLDSNLVSSSSEMHPLVLTLLGNWRSLGTSQFIINVISQGYKIPFFKLPTPFFKASNASALSNSLFVSQAVNELLILLKRFFACLILSIRFQFPLIALANKG